MTTPSTLAVITIGPRNCLTAVGRPWDWTLAFARRSGVPVWRVGPRTRLIPARDLFVALAAAERAPGPTFEEELAAARESFARELADERSKQ